MYHHRITGTGLTPTIPASSDFTDGSWLATDLGEGEIMFNMTDNRAWWRSNTGIIELATDLQNLWTQSGTDIVLDVPVTSPFLDPNVLPTNDSVSDLGSASAQWKNLYLYDTLSFDTDITIGILNGGTSNISIGYNAAATQGIAIGAFSVSLGVGAVSLGFNATGVGDDSITMGSSAIASGNSSIALGIGATANTVSSISIGNTATATGNSTIAIGGGSTGSGTRSIAVGGSATAIADRSTAIGFNTVTSNQGEFAHAPAELVAGQCGIISFSGTTTNTTTTELLLGSGVRFNIAAGESFVCDMQVLAQSAAIDVAMFTGKGVIKNVAGTTSLVGTFIMTQDAADVSMATTAVTVTANDTNDTLKVEVNGIAATTIRWIASVRFTKLY